MLWFTYFLGCFFDIFPYYTLSEQRASVLLFTEGIQCHLDKEMRKSAKEAGREAIENGL